MFNFASLFTGDVVAASFDNAIHADAANGRVNAAFTAALVASYGVTIPAAPAAAVKAVNDWIGADKAPRIAKGHGATQAAPAVARALHALACALHAGGRAKGLPMVAALPDWADADKLAAKSAERSAKAKAAVKPAAKPVAPTLAAEQSKAAPTTNATELRAQAVNLVLSAANAGALTQAQIDALRAALAVAQPAASKAGKTRNNPAPVRPVAPMLGEALSDDVQALAKAATAARKPSAAGALVLESMARDAEMMASQRGAAIDVPAITH